MNEYQVQINITDALVSFTVRAESPEKALEYGRQKLNKMSIFSKELEHIDSTYDVTGVY